MMLKLFKEKSQKVGAPPGTLMHVGERKAEETTIQVIDYDATLFQESTPRSR